MAFIVFEGLDGSGKSTLIQGLKQALDQNQISHVVTREPGGTVLGEEIRQLLLQLNGDPPVPRAEILLYQASRAQHVDKKIRPALNNNQWVLCDRFTASTYAFQSGGRSINEIEVNWLNQFAVDECWPDLWVLIDLSVEECERRMKSRNTQTGQSLDRFESEQKDFHERVRQAYLRLAKMDQQKWLVLSGAESPDKLLNQLLTFLRDKKWLP